jgi:hypothetical protein
MDGWTLLFMLEAGAIVGITIGATLPPRHRRAPTHLKRSQHDRRVRVHEISERITSSAGPVEAFRPCSARPGMANDGDGECPLVVHQATGRHARHAA